MKITVVGIGNSGSAIGGDLALRGHDVTMLKSSTRPLSEHQKSLFKTSRMTVLEGESAKTADLALVTSDCELALRGAELVIVCTQTDQHEPVLEKLSPYLVPGQTILFEPGYLATALVLKTLPTRDITVVEAASTPVNSRVVEPGVVRIAFRNVTNQVGIWPPTKQEATASLLAATGYDWVFYQSVVEAALHNPNLIVHTVGGFMSIPRIEATEGDYWMYKEVFTPSVWNLVEALDNEKRALLSALGLPDTPYVNSCHERNDRNNTENPKDAFFDWALNHSQRGPSTADSRYLTEDVPQGLAMLESLGKATGVPTPVCSSLITLSSAALRRDFRSSSARTQESLGLTQLQKITGMQLGS